MAIERRAVLRGVLTGGAAVGAGWLAPGVVFAEWPKEAFDSDNMDGAMQALFKGDTPEESGDIKVKAPDIAENGAVVPVSVETTLSDIKSITIVVPDNPVPLIASFDLAPGAKGAVSTRIKMGKTSNVIALVKSGDKLYSAQKEVKVTIGGCGG